MMLGVLLPAAARGSIIILIAWLVVATALRSRPASLRHTIWIFAIASQIALPIAALVLPQRPIDLGPVGAAMTGAARSIASVPSPPPAVGSAARPGGSAATAGASARATPSTIMNSAGPGSRLGAALDLITLVWLVGALLMVVRFAVGTILVAREMQRASRPLQREWIVLAGQIQEEMDLRREAVLLWGSNREVPYTWGVLAPVVCLPADADKWSIDRLRIVMIHELAHVERFDTLSELAAQIALVIFWFNPLLWLAVRRMRTEREHACDDRVLMRGVKPSTYVEELVNMMKSIGSGGIAPGFGAIAMARRTQFEARMFAVLDEHADRHGVGRKSIAGVAAAMVALLLVVGSVRPATASPALHQTITTSSGKVDTWQYSDFDEMVADCKREKPKDKPRIGVRYCEVRTVDLSALSGAIDFRGGYVDGVIFTTKGSPRTPGARALIRAEAVTPEDARKLASQVRTVLKDGVLQSEGPGSGHSQLWSVLYEVTLPVGRSVTARTENGQISLADFTGNADVEAENGPVEAFGAAGDIKGRTENGPLIVGLGGSRWEGAGLDLRSQNGPIYLSIPDGYSAHLITGTVNGPMDLRRPLMVTRMRGKAIETDLGSGGTTVRVSTINGPADIR
jgi:beta-lactamase regulating signal transducer with metallopeptidase domain